MGKDKKAAVAPEGKIMPIDIGIDETDRQAIADGLANLLADTYTLYLKTHNFHWNVTGPMFQTLHLMFEGQYNELALAVDRLPNAFVPWASRLLALTKPLANSLPSKKRTACPALKT